MYAAQTDLFARHPGLEGVYFGTARPRQRSSALPASRPSMRLVASPAGVSCLEPTLEAISISWGLQQASLDHLTESTGRADATARQLDSEDDHPRATGAQRPVQPQALRAAGSGGVGRTRKREPCAAHDTAAADSDHHDRIGHRGVTRTAADPVERKAPDCLNELASPCARWPPVRFVARTPDEPVGIV